MPMISEAMGFFASALVLLTFTMKDMRTLRIIAIFSNFAFIGYGALEWLPPVLCLHLLLLPMNLLRLKQIQVRGAGKAAADRELIHQPQARTAERAISGSDSELSWSAQRRRICRSTRDDNADQAAPAIFQRIRSARRTRCDARHRWHSAGATAPNAYQLH
jgi:hypothetical protein